MGLESDSRVVRRVPGLSSMTMRAVIAVVASVPGFAHDAYSQSATTTRELTAMIDQYTADWDSHDAAVLASDFTTDADMIMGNGPIMDGRAAIQAWWQEYFAVQDPARRLTIDVEGVRAVTGDVAVINVHTTTGGRTGQGTELVAREFRGTWVVVRERGTWMIAAMRGLPTLQDRIIRGSGS